MTRTLIAMAAIVATMGSLAAVNASAMAKPRIVSATQDGHPILLARMVVSAAPLSN